MTTDATATPDISDETARLAALGRGEDVIDNQTDEGAQKPQRPDYIPEKFWDSEKGEARYEDLAKSYAELEKRIGEPKGKADNEDQGSDDEEANKAAKEAAEAAGIPADLFAGAQAEFAEKGDLSPETREKILGVGIDAATLDTYLAGVKALSEQLTRSVYETAGGEDAYHAAVAWARDNWTQGQIDKFDAALNDADMRVPLIRGLMADYTAAGGSGTEGNLTRPGTGPIDGGDLYRHPEEFTRDLAAADKAGDSLARQKAVQKLERSKKAKTITHITPRSPFGY